MVKLDNIVSGSGDESGRKTIFTSGRMTAVWAVAHELGFKNITKFWEYAEEVGWDFYDVLHEASP